MFPDQTQTGVTDTPLSVQINTQLTAATFLATNYVTYFDYLLDQMPWDSSEEQMGGPREMRIHVQRVIAIPAPHNMPPQNMPSQNMPPPPETMGPFAPPPPPPQNDQNEVSS